MTRAETQQFLAFLVYGLATAFTLVAAYLAWRKIRPRRRDYRYHQEREGRPKGVWGWE